MLPTTLGELFQKVLGRVPDRIALSDVNKNVTYQELNDLSSRLAQVFVNLGLSKNKRIGILMENCVEFVITDLAIYKIGAAKVPLNHLLSYQDLSYISENSGIELLVVSSKYIDDARKLLDDPSNSISEILIFNENDKKIEIKESQNAYRLISSSQPLSNIIITNKEDIAGIFYTGGTTGKPKGVVHTQETIINTLTQHLLALEIEDGEKMLLTTPLAHAAGFYVWVGLLKNVTFYIEQKFDVEKVLKLIDKEKIQFTFMVPTMIYRILDFKELSNYSINSIRTITYGAAPITKKRLEQALKVFGPVFVQHYGQMEVPDVATVLSKKDHLGNDENKLMSCGSPTLMTEIKIVNIETGDEVETGEIGEVLIKSPFVMKGYFNLPEKTAETIVEGWLRTGDVGYVDKENYLYLLDRMNDVIISGGFNVYTSEIESVIQAYPDINQVAVIGIPHDDWGEAVKAFIIPNNDDLDIDKLHKFCKNALAKYKVPKDYEVVTSLPLTPYGKFDKKELRKRYWGNNVRQIN